MLMLILLSLLLSGCSIAELNPWPVIKQTIRWATIEIYKLFAISLVLWAFSFIARAYERKLIRIVVFVLFLNGMVEIVLTVFQ